MKEKIKKILIIIIVFSILSSWVGCIFIEPPVYAKPSETSPRTGHTQEEAGETIAAWALNFKEKHEPQVRWVHYTEPDRGASYNLPVSDSDLTTIYTSDCNGWVSFVVHHALGIGPEEFVRFVYVGPSVGDEEGFEQVGDGSDLSICKPGDILTFPGHVALFAGDGNSIGLIGDCNIQLGPVEKDVGGTPNGVFRIRADIAASANFAYLQGAGSAATPFSMKGTKVSDCAKNENGKATGGQAGDQTSEEYSVKEWYDFGQKYVLRNPKLDVAETIAKISIMAANNDAIGYGQDKRLTYWEQLQKCNFEPDKITTECEADCSSSTCANIKAAGNKMDNDKLKSLSEGIGTKELKNKLEEIGFTTLTDPKYLKGPEELLAGDVILSEEHASIFVGNGELGQTVNYEIDPITVNLDNQIFQYSGVPKTVMYIGSNNIGIWLFDLIGQFINFLASVILNGIKASILGYVMTAHGAIDSALKFMDGNQQE